MYEWNPKPIQFIGDTTSFNQNQAARNTSYNNFIVALVKELRAMGKDFEIEVIDPGTWNGIYLTPMQVVMKTEIGRASCRERV